MNLERILFNIGCMATANSIPLYFATVALPSILRVEGMSLSTTGLLGALMLPWAFKFLWAPILDKYYISTIGKRKSWILLTQALMLPILLLLSVISIQHSVYLFFACVALLLMGAATHYLATSAYIIEQLSENEIRYGNYVHVIGTACGSFIGGGLFLLIYAKYSWLYSVLTLLIISLALTMIQILIKEKGILIRDASLKISPSITSFFKSRNNIYLLKFCLIYRGCEGVVMGMQQPFLIDQHIKVSDIGMFMGVSSLTLNIFAAGIASILLNKQRYAIWLLALGVARSFCYFALATLAYYKVYSLYVIFICVGINMAIRSMEMIVLYTFFMKNCSLNQAATDISILLCAEIVIYSIGTMSSGYLAKILGYSGLFITGSGLSLISTFICACLMLKVSDKGQLIR